MKKNSKRLEELEEDNIIDFRIMFYLETKTIQNLKIA